MLALVTCQIFPPSIWYGKKMNSWHLTSRLTARSFSESTASRVRSGRCPRQCATLLHGQMCLQEKTPVLQFGHTLEQNSSICPSISYLWMVDLVMRFFSCGASLWRSSTRIRPKKGPAPWFPDALHTQTDRSTPPQSQQAEIDFLSLYVRKLSGKKIWAFFGMIFYSWPHIMPRDPHPLSARFLENSVF